MTTVVLNHDMMCADSLCNDDGCMSYVQKVYDTPYGLVGFSGELSQGLKFVEWILDNGEHALELNENFEGVLLTRDKEIYTYDNTLIPMKMEQDYYAIGTGKPAALAAMLLTGDPMVATRVAIEVDINSGGEVQCLKVKDLPKPKKRRKKKK